MQKQSGTKNIKKHNIAGFSLVELIISMAIFGIIMLGLNSMLAANSKATQSQSSAAQANLSAKQSLLRITDIVAQAHYIYPANQEITLELSDGSTKIITTGPDSLAVLLPEGTTYCPGNSQQYCGYIFSVDTRDRFSEILGNSKHSSNYALVGWRAFNLNWPQSSLPTTVLANWFNVQNELLVDSIVPYSNYGTNLASTERLTSSRSRPWFDEENLFSNQDINKNQSNGLISSVEPKIVIAYGSGNNIKTISRASHIFARAVPRGSLPNP